MTKQKWRSRNLTLKNRMTQTEYLAALEQLHLTRLGAGKTFGLSGRQAQRVAMGHTKVTGPLGKLIRLSLQHGLSGEKIQVL
jgi:energy-coupling factor transporter ATP-binding protein EcfA2